MFRRMLGIAAVFALMLCVGCDGPTELSWLWVKPGATKQDLRADIDFCKKDTMQKADAANVHSTVGVQAIYDFCMKSHGWEYRKPSANLGHQAVAEET